MCVNQLLHHRVTMELNFFQLEYVLQYTCEDVVVIIARSNIIIQALSKRFLVIQILELFSPKKQNNDETTLT